MKITESLSEMTCHLCSSTQHIRVCVGTNKTKHHAFRKLTKGSMPPMAAVSNVFWWRARMTQLRLFSLTHRRVPVSLSVLAWRGKNWGTSPVRSWRIPLQWILLFPSGLILPFCVFPPPRRQNLMQLDIFDGLTLRWWLVFIDFYFQNWTAHWSEMLHSTIVHLFFYWQITLQLAFMHWTAGVSSTDYLGMGTFVMANSDTTADCQQSHCNLIHLLIAGFSGQEVSFPSVQLVSGCNCSM